MNRKIILIALVLVGFITAQNVQAQQGEFKINPGLEVGIPMGDFSDMNSIGFGVTVKGYYGISDEGAIGLTLGYLTFSGKKVSGIKTGSSDIIPIMAGYRHHFNQFYAEGQLGFANVKFKEGKVSGGGFDFGDIFDGIFEDDDFDFGDGGGSYSSTEFSWALGVGYMFNNFDVGVRYQSIQTSGSSLGWIGLRVGYSFDL